MKVVLFLQTIVVDHRLLSLSCGTMERNTPELFSRENDEPYLKIEIIQAQLHRFKGTACTVNKVEHQDLSRRATHGYSLKENSSKPIVTR